MAEKRMSTGELTALSTSLVHGGIDKEFQTVIKERLRAEISALALEQKRQKAVDVENARFGELFIKRKKARLRNCSHRKGVPSQGQTELQGQEVYVPVGRSKEIYVCSRCASEFIWPHDMVNEQALEAPCPADLRPAQSSVGRPYYN